MAIVPINTETGEVAEGYKIISPEQEKAQKEYAKAEEQKRIGRSREFTNANMPYLSEVYSALTTAQCGYLMLLQCYIEFDSAVISNADGSPMTTANMIEALQLTKKRSTFYNFLNKCLDHDIIRKNGANYAVNTRYHFKGTMSGQVFVMSYSAAVKSVYSEVKASDIGLIYRMLPLVHMKTNALCSNPFEKNAHDVEWLNRAELAEIIGVDPATLSRRLPKMKFGNQYVLARIKVGKGDERYIMNHWVFSRTGKVPDETQQAMFNVNKKRN